MKRWHWQAARKPRLNVASPRRFYGLNTTPGGSGKGIICPAIWEHATVTVQNLKVVKVDVENNLLLVKGAVPGHKNSYLIIKKAKKEKINGSNNLTYI